MNRIENEQIKFFFQHEAQIREWAKLVTEANKFMDRFYRSLKGDLDAALGSGSIAADGVESFLYDGAWPSLGLLRQDWREKANVHLGWKRNASFPPHGQLYCGVYISDKKYRNPFTKEACPDYPKRSELYPAYKDVKPPDRFWEDDEFKKFRGDLVETILTTWKDLAPLVDEAIGHGAS